MLSVAELKKSVVIMRLEAEKKRNKVKLAHQPVNRRSRSMSNSDDVVIQDMENTASGN